MQNNGTEIPVDTNQESEPEKKQEAEPPPSRATPESRMMLVARDLQASSEECERKANSSTLPPAIRWYYKAGAVAYALAAEHIRESLAPTVANGPPPMQDFMAIHHAVANVMQAASAAQQNGAVGNGEQDEEEPASD